MGLFSDADYEIDCSPDSKNGQFYCEAKDKKGNMKAKVLISIGPDGTKSLVKESGSMVMIKKLKEYMNEQVKIRPPTSQQ